MNYPTEFPAILTSDEAAARLRAYVVYTGLARGRHAERLARHVCEQAVARGIATPTGQVIAGVAWAQGGHLTRSSSAVWVRSIVPAPRERHVGMPINRFVDPFEAASLWLGATATRVRRLWSRVWRVVVG